MYPSRYVLLLPVFLTLLLPLESMRSLSSPKPTPAQASWMSCAASSLCGPTAPDATSVPSTSTSSVSTYTSDSSRDSLYSRPAAPMTSPM